MLTRQCAAARLLALARTAFMLGYGTLVAPIWCGG